MKAMKVKTFVRKVYGGLVLIVNFGQAHHLGYGRLLFV